MLTDHDMYDAIPSLAHNIPANPYAVAGYVDSIHYTWPASLWDQFPHSLHCTISTTGRVLAHFADCENGDLTPAQAYSAAASGRVMGIYCNLSTWPSVQAVGPRRFPMWIAHYDGLRNLPVLNGEIAVAKQYSDSGGYDTSCLSDTFIQLIGGTVVTDPAPLSAADVAAQAVRVAALYHNQSVKAEGWGNTPGNILNEPNGLAAALAEINSKLDALTSLVQELSKPTGSGTITGTFTVG